MWSRRRRSTPVWHSACLTDNDRGFFAIKDEREAVNQDDFNKAVRKVAEAKKLEGKLEYQKL